MLPFQPVLSTLYSAVARRRREYYASRPHLRKRLRRPVISVGNIAVGGRGKTPTAAMIARLLLEMGERPAILSRGYARRRVEEGVIVVRDPEDLRSDVARAGDEPFMLARQLPGVSILVCPDRYLAGRLAEHHLGATVHVLDDGFQHFQLDRDLDVVIVDRADVERPVTLPRGRLREPLDVLIAADAICTTEPDVPVEAYGTDTEVFLLRRSAGMPDGVAAGAAVFAVCGIAVPERFVADVRSAGFDIRGERSFPDHHLYSARDLEQIASAARAAGARVVLTTEKDYVRMLFLRPFPIPIAWVPLTIEPDAPETFRNWLAGSVAAARDLILD